MMTIRQATWLVIAASTAARFAWAASLGPDTNEAYYYAYTCHPSLSYFDHPPMVAAVASLGPILVPNLPPTLGLRTGFLLLFAGSTWLMARLTTRAFGERAGLLAALALNATGYFGILVGTTASPDGPLLFFWLLTLDRLSVALVDPRRLIPWLAAGLGLGGAMLSKYHAILLPAGFVLLLVTRPSARRCLRVPGPYLAAALSVAAFTPVLLWNAGNRWASFLFQAWRAVGSPGIHPERLALVVGGQLLFLFPWMWLALVATLVRTLRRGPRRWSEVESLLLTQAIAVLGFFLAVTPFRRVMPHWPLIGFVPLMPLMGRDWSAALATRPGRVRGRLIFVGVAPLVVAGLIAAQAGAGLFQDRYGRFLGLTAADSDPTVELCRWRQVADALRRGDLLKGRGTFLLADSWRSSAQLTLATGGAVPVACYDRDPRSFAFWSRPEDWVGRDAILVTLDGPAPEIPSFAPWFERIEPAGVFPVLRSGVAVGTFRLFRCVRQTRPFPFRYPGQ